MGGANNDLAAPVVSAPVLPEQATLGSSLDPGSSTVNDRYRNMGNLGIDILTLFRSDRAVFYLDCLSWQT